MRDERRSLRRRRRQECDHERFAKVKPAVWPTLGKDLAMRCAAPLQSMRGVPKQTNLERADDQAASFWDCPRNGFEASLGDPGHDG
jgi:hypothetical protein